jgi:preprotein translocase subunit Sec63
MNFYHKLVAVSGKTTPEIRRNFWKIIWKFNEEKKTICVSERRKVLEKKKGDIAK